MEEALIVFIIAAVLATVFNLMIEAILAFIRFIKEITY